jgi:Phosphopantetheine attachment site
MSNTEIWTNLIGPARPIGRADKFFEMGGHSLLALQALRQIENQLGVRLDLRVFFQESLTDIAMRCRSERVAGDGEHGGKAGEVQGCSLRENQERI